MDRLFEKPRRWNAKWIWTPGAAHETNRVCLFRREFDLDTVPARALLTIAADTRYRLWVNDQPVGRGAPQSQPFLQYYDTRDLTQLLAKGTNVLAVEVYHLGRLPDTRGGLLAELVDGEGRMLLGTGADWRCMRADAHQSDTYFFRMNKTTPFQEFYDARREPEGWRRVGFDDSAWQTSAIVSGRISDRPPAAGPWSRLVPRDIPFMREVPVLPVRVALVEENLELSNRMRGEDLSIVLSMPGKPIEYARVENADALLGDGGETVLECSTNHLGDLAFDGIYDPSVLLDFGRVRTAYPEIAIEGPKGAILDIGYAERLIDGHFNNSLEGQFADRLILDGGSITYQPFNWKAFRYLKIRVREAFEPVRIRSLRAINTTYPFEDIGGFESTDETMNAVFDISRETLRLCANEFLMDTPWREQAQWLGDVASVTVPAIHACFGDAAIVGKFYRQAGENQHQTGMVSNVSNVVNHGWLNPIPDYSLWWVMGLWREYLFTGDPRWVHEFYAQATRVMAAHRDYINEHGLIEDMPYWVFVDWADTDRRGECAAYNAMTAGALEAFVEMARLRNDAYAEAWASEALAGIRGAFQERLFDPERGVFPDARIDGAFSDKVSEHANASAIRWGLCDDATAAAVIEKIWEKGDLKATEAQPFFMVVVLGALRRAGRMDLAMRLVRERWGGRMVAKGCTSVLEEWYENGSYRNGPFWGFMRTHSHAWSACPAEFLIADLAGLEILEPGMSKVRVAPYDAGFDYTATYATPHGPLHVEWRGGKANVDAPEGVELVE